MSEQVWLGIDAGTKRIGIARAAVPPGFSEELVTVEAGDNLADRLREVITEQQPTRLIVGKPRNQAGELTAQTEWTVQWVAEYIAPLGIEYDWQDESLSSYRAETMLKERGKPYDKPAIDRLAAALILADYIEQYAPSNQTNT